MAFLLVFKRYAPFATFGGGFHGDNRSTPSLTDSARTMGVLTLDFTKPELSLTGSSGVSFHSLLPSVRQIGTTKVTIHRQSFNKFTRCWDFEVQSAGALPLAQMAFGPGVKRNPSPDIDTFIEARVTLLPTGALQINGALRGDDFPNAEIFLVNAQNGNHQLVHHFITSGGRNTGPLGLFGAARRTTLANISATVRL